MKLNFFVLFELINILVLLTNLFIILKHIKSTRLKTVFSLCYLFFIFSLISEIIAQSLDLIFFKDLIILFTDIKILLLFISLIFFIFLVFYYIENKIPIYLHILNGIIILLILILLIFCRKKCITVDILLSKTGYISKYGFLVNPIISLYLLFYFIFFIILIIKDYLNTDNQFLKIRLNNSIKILIFFIAVFIIFFYIENFFHFISFAKVSLNSISLYYLFFTVYILNKKNIIGSIEIIKKKVFFLSILTSLLSFFLLLFITFLYIWCNFFTMNFLELIIFSSINILIILPLYLNIKEKLAILLYKDELKIFNEISLLINILKSIKNSSEIRKRLWLWLSNFLPIFSLTFILIKEDKKIEIINFGEKKISKKEFLKYSINKSNIITRLNNETYYYKFNIENESEIIIFRLSEKKRVKGLINILTFIFIFYQLFYLNFKFYEKEKEEKKLEMVKSIIPKVIQKIDTCKKLFPIFIEEIKSKKVEKKELIAKIKEITKGLEIKK